MALNFGIGQWGSASSHGSQTITSGSGTFTVPAGVTSIEIQCWAGGGGTQDNTLAANNTGGAGGGAFSQKTALTVSPGDSLIYVVGASGMNGSTATPGGTTSVVHSSITVCLALGGGAGTSLIAGAGGLASGGTGDVTFSGGAGHLSNAGNTGGGGGSSAGSSSNGNDAPGPSGTNTSANPGPAVTGGGAGGQGESPLNGAGQNGFSPGGGAGSVSRNDATVGLIGGSGKIIFTW